MHIFSIRTPISGQPHYWNAAMDRDVKIFLHAPAAIPEVELMGRSYDLKKNLKHQAHVIIHSGCITEVTLKFPLKGKMIVLWTASEEKQ